MRLGFAVQSTANGHKYYYIFDSVKSDFPASDFEPDGVPIIIGTWKILYGSVSWTFFQLLLHLRLHLHLFSC